MRPFLNKWIWKTSHYYFWTNLPEKRRSLYRKDLWQCTKKERIFLIGNYHVTMTKKDAYEKNEMQLQHHSLTFIDKTNSLLSATSNLPHSPMAHNTTASLDKVTCTDYVDFGKYQDRFGRFSWSKNDSKYLDVKLKSFKKNENKEFRLVQNLTQCSRILEGS